jgi:hypothetical protein
MSIQSVLGLSLMIVLLKWRRCRYRRREADAHAPLRRDSLPSKWAPGPGASLGLCGSSNVSSLAGDPTLLSTRVP